MGEDASHGRSQQLRKIDPEDGKMEEDEDQVKFRGELKFP